ncbi:DUF1905 domain-containing protein [Panacibacter sp. DH6]|uniref:DUF1905 domain-containing protein n=1 Tax=Panacibacter microcysteis TaxID=2793269 RepID=A0A931GZS8_9BACT|nr:YdeI/OmpD-associated family protein [Panacibacter microcysteis]MBG9378342.1 DUF1905 domain-containing protein [Panacibacter microcysteis]
MVQFTTVILKFDQQGEKTGWTYIIVPADIAQQLMPGNKKSFRVKGRLDEFAIERLALMPAGGGDFIMPLNAATRKGIGKKQGAMVTATLEADNKEIQPPEDFIECLKDEPGAYDFFFGLAKSHRLYFINWINEAKTIQTKTKRIAQAVNALARQLDFGTMIRSIKKENEMLKGR